MPNYSMRHGRPLGASSTAFGGAALNLPVGCMEGESDMIYTFDDFNGVVPLDTFGAAAIWEDSGWILTDDATPTADAISMNDLNTVTANFDSCIRVFPGTDDDDGGSMMLDLLAGAVSAEVTTTTFPHIWIPETAALPTTSGVAGEVLDNTTWVFACRVGLRADETTTGNGDWDSKAFIGWADTGDTSILTSTDGVITIASQAELIGFHFPEDGSIDAVSHRTAATAMAEGTNFTELVAAGGVDGTTANGALAAGDTMWFDLALRMDITNQSDDNANGSTRFFFRGPLNIVAPDNAGKDEFAQPGEGYLPWQEHGTVLTNQTPNNASALVPVIEVLNGPTAGRDGIFYVDWWCFGRSRPSRSRR